MEEGQKMTPAFDLIVIGEGFAGLTCASEAAKLGLVVATYESEFYGGLVVNVNELEHFEEADGLSGMDYAGMLAMGNKRAGVKSIQAEVRCVRRVDGGFEVDTDSGAQTARFVVIATGAKLKKLGVPGEAELEGRGVSHCADCDAPMFTGAEVVVAGNGDWALQDALLLAQECAAVHIVYPGTGLKACDDYISRVTSESKIILHPNHSIIEVLGDETGMTGVTVRNDQGESAQLKATGLFALPGLEPNGAIAPKEVERDVSGYLKVGPELETSISGLWAIGQVRSGFGGWLKDAVLEARQVAKHVKSRSA